MYAFHQWFLLKKTRVITFILSGLQNNEGGEKRGPNKEHGWRSSKKISQFSELYGQVNLALKKSLEIIQRSYKTQKRK